MLPPVRLAIQDAPVEMLSAIILGASPIIGSFWVDPDITRWTVFAVGVAMTVGVLLVALRPVRRRPA